MPTELPLFDIVVDAICSYLGDAKSIACFSASCRYTRFLMTRHATLGERLWVKLFNETFGRPLQRLCGDYSLSAFQLFSRKMTRRALKRLPTISTLLVAGGENTSSSSDVLAARGGSSSMIRSSSSSISSGVGGESLLGPARFVALSDFHGGPPIAIAAHDSGSSTAWLPLLRRSILPASARGDLLTPALAAKARRDAK